MVDNNFYFESDWINHLETEIHWRSYWMQQSLVQKYLSAQDKILEVGVGSSFCANYMRSKDYNLTTLDIDRDKKPDIVANICLDNVKYSYSAILAFEIFEHIPFNCFIKVLDNMRDSDVNYILMSIPESKIEIFKTCIKIPKMNLKFNMNIPRYLLPKILKERYNLCKAHNWELNYNIQYKKPVVDKTIENLGWNIQECISSKYNNHVFYVLKNANISKKNNQ